MVPRIIMLALVACLALLPAAVEPVKRRKLRFEIVERTSLSAASISLPGLNVATSYPDTIAVSGPRDAKLIDLDLILFGFTRGAPQDLDVLLVAPDGRAALVMRDAGGESDVPGVKLVLDDDARSALPEFAALAGGRYRPANHDESEVSAESEPGSNGEPGENGEPGADGEPGAPGDGGGDSDAFPEPVPDPGENVALSTFRGLDPAREWQLSLRADGRAAGSLADWGLRITTKRPR